MPDDILIEVVVADQVLGSNLYTASVRITNMSQELFDRVTVDPISLPGKLVFEQRDADETPVSQLEAQRRRLIDEMERQVVVAYERNRIRNLPIFERVLYVYMRVFGQVQPRPLWAREAMKIQEWGDIERLENDVISKEKDESFLRKAFGMNKDKLERCLKRIEDAESAQRHNSGSQLNRGLALSSRAQLSFPFKLKAPHLLRARQFDLEFTVTYHLPNTDQVVQRSVSQRVTLRPSPFAVPLGGMLGAASGFVIRATVLNPGTTWSEVSTWSALGGSILLGLVFALFTARKPEAKQAIAVEDFVGGVIIGALVGLFSQQVIDKLAALLK